MEDKSDRYLIESCIKKDLAAWSGLIKKYSDLAYVSIENRLRKCGVKLSSHEIEDIRQDVFSDIWKDEKLSRIKNRDDISYWIAITSANAAIEHIRSKDTRKMFNTVSLSSGIGDDDMSEILPSDALGPDDELMRAEMGERIEEAIELLPGTEKLITKLCLIHGKKHHEIAEFLNVPMGTVSSYVKRAKEKLKKALKDR